MKESFRKSREVRMNADIDSMDKEFDYLTNACSACDCTGLIPANPHPLREDSFDSYQDIYAYQPPKIVQEKESQ